MLRKVAIGLVALLIPSLALAAARTASADGLWSSTGTWGGAAVPTLADTCTVNSGVEVICDAAPCQCGDLLIAAPAGGIVMRAGARNLKLGNATGAAGDGNLTIGGYLIGGPSHVLEFNLNRTTELSMGVVTVTGRFEWAGAIRREGELTTVGAITGSIALTGNLVTTSRTITVTDVSNPQPSNNYYAGKYLVPTSGTLKGVYIPITTGGASLTEMVLNVDTRGLFDSRNASGRVIPANWIPGDNGASLPYNNATCTGATAPWPCCTGAGTGTCTMTVANGGYIVTVGADVFSHPDSLCGGLSSPFSCCTGAGTGTCTSDVNLAGSRALGSRIACAADIGAANDADFRRVCYVNSATSLTLCTPYGTASCAAGGPLVLLVDNQPARAVRVEEILRPGDKYRIVEPAVIQLTAGRESNASPDNHYNMIFQNASTGRLVDAIIDDCGFDRGADGDGEDLPCIQVNEIDNSTAGENFTLARVDFMRPQGEAIIALSDSKNITLDGVSGHDCNDGGFQDNHECHGVIFKKSTVLPTNNILRNSRIVRVNDAPLGLTGGALSERFCAGCAAYDNVFGYWPANFGGSVSIAATSPLSDFIFARNLLINGWSVAFTPSNTGSALNRAAGFGNLYLNNADTSGAFRAGSYLAPGSPGDNIDSLNRIMFSGNAIYGSAGPCFLRGDLRDNFCATLNPAPAVTGPIKDAALIRGNIVLGGPFTAATGGDGIFTRPTSSGLASLHPALTVVEDNVAIANQSQTLDASCVASLAPWPCCTGAGTGTCNAPTHYTMRIDLNESGAENLDYVLRHNSMICNDRFATGQSVFGINIEPSNQPAEANDNIMFDCERSFIEGGGGTGDTTCRANLALAAFSAAEFSGGAASCAVGSNSNVNTASLSWPRPDVGDLSSFPGSTPWTSLSQDGTPLGVRVAGPPNFEQLRSLYPWPLFYDPAGRAPGDASYISGLLPVEILTTNSISNSDTDRDTIWDLHDNCFKIWNPLQIDTDADGIGDPCE